MNDIQAWLHAQAGRASEGSKAVMISDDWPDGEWLPAPGYFITRREVTGDETALHG